MEDQGAREDKALYVEGLLKFSANQGKPGEMKNSAGILVFPLQQGFRRCVSCFMELHQTSFSVSFGLQVGEQVQNFFGFFF